MQTRRKRLRRTVHNSPRRFEESPLSQARKKTTGTRFLTIGIGWGARRDRKVTDDTTSIRLPHGRPTATLLIPRAPRSSRNPSISTSSVSIHTTPQKKVNERSPLKGPKPPLFSGKTWTKFRQLYFSRAQSIEATCRHGENLRSDVLHRTTSPRVPLALTRDLFTNRRVSEV
jgi:hypothetical protein